jgi:hypothetical protein
MLAQRERAPEPVSQYRTDVPPLLLNVLARLMAKKPEERYQTPAEVAQVLEQFLDPSRTAAPKPIILPEVVEPQTARPAAKPTVLELADTERGARPPAKIEKTEEVPRPRRKRRFALASCLLGCLGLVVLGVALIGGAGYLGYNVVTAAWDRFSDTFGFTDETAAWQRLERDWKPPPSGADEDIFPASFGEFSRSYIDDKAAVAALDLNWPGKHAHYKGRMWDSDVYVFRSVPQANKEALYQKLIEQTKDDHFGAGLHEEQARLRNSPRGSKLIYDTFGAASGRQRGCFWWKDGYLFLLRCEPIDDPEVLLRKFLSANRAR